MKRVRVFVFALMVLLVACDQAVELPPQQEPSQIPTETKIPPTETPQPVVTLPRNTKDSTAVAFTTSEQNLGNTGTFSVVIKDVDMELMDYNGDTFPDLFLSMSDQPDQYG